MDVPVQVEISAVTKYETGSGGPLIWPFSEVVGIDTKHPMSESCGNPAAETGEALMPSELLIQCISTTSLK